MKTGALQLQAHLFEIFWRQATGDGVWSGPKDLRQIDGGVSRNREGDVRLPCRHPFDADDDERGNVEHRGKRRYPRLSLMLRSEKGDDRVRNVALQHLGTPVFPVFQKPI